MKRHCSLLILLALALAATIPAYGQTQQQETSIYDNPNEYDQTLTYVPAEATAQTSVTMLLNQVTRLIDDQRIELVVEVRNPQGDGNFSFLVNGQDISKKFTATTTQFDCNGTSGIVFRLPTPMGFQPAKSCYRHPRARRSCSRL